MQAEHLRMAATARAHLWWLLGCLWLICSSAQAAAPAGQWWNLSYNYRMLITIPAGTSTLPTDHAVSVVFNHASEVAGSRSLASGNDVRIVRWNGTGWNELDRVIDPDTAWITSSTRIWFTTEQSIAANASDTDYYIYYNNPSAGTPPQTAENVFLLYDDFSLGSIVTSRWTRSGGVNIVSGVAELGPSASLTATSAY